MKALKIILIILGVLLTAGLAYYFLIMKKAKAVPAVNGLPHPIDTTPPIMKSGMISLNPPLSYNNGEVVLYYRYDNYSSDGKLISSYYYDKNKKIVAIPYPSKTRKGAFIDISSFLPYYAQ